VIYLFMIVFFLIAFFMVCLILLQEGKGGGIAAMGGGGMDGVMGVRNPLRRWTAYLAVVFVILALGINSYIAHKSASDLPVAPPVIIPEAPESGTPLTPDVPTLPGALAPDANAPAPEAPAPPASPPPAADTAAPDAAPTADPKATTVDPKLAPANAPEGDAAP